MMTSTLNGTPGKGRAAGTAQGILLVTAPLFSLLGAILMAPLLATIQESFRHVAHASVLVPMLLTAPALCVALLSPFIGVLADRVGRRPVLLWSFGLYGIAGTAPMYLQSLHSILASRFLVGVAEAGLITAATTLISDYFSGDSRQKWFAYQHTALPWIAAVLTAATGVIGDVNWRLTFSFYGLSFVALLFAAIFVFEPSHVRVTHQVAKRPLQLTRRLPQWSHLLLIIAIAVPGSIAFYIAPVELAYLLQIHGFHAPHTAGTLTALGLVFGPAGALLSRKLTHVSVGRLIAISMATMGGGLILMALGHDVRVIATGFVIQQMGGNLMLVTGLTFVFSLANPQGRGAYAGVWWFFYMIAQFLTPVLMSGLLWLTGDRSGAVLAASGLIAATCVWLLLAAGLRGALVSDCAT